jgi:hypothetical protein
MKKKKVELITSISYVLHLIDVKLSNLKFYVYF